MTIRPSFCSQFRKLFTYLSIELNYFTFIEKKCRKSEQNLRRSVIFFRLKFFLVSKMFVQVQNNSQTFLFVNHEEIRLAYIISFIFISTELIFFLEFLILFVTQ